MRIHEDTCVYTCIHVYTCVYMGILSLVPVTPPDQPGVAVERTRVDPFFCSHLPVL